jgi:hypothetical protein
MASRPDLFLACSNPVAREGDLFEPQAAKLFYKYRRFHDRGKALDLAAPD